MDVIRQYIDLIKRKERITFMQFMIKVTDAEYEMLKAYAAARRKYEVGKGFNIDAVIAQMVSIGIEAISETTILDKEGNVVNWRGDFVSDDDMVSKRCLYRKYKK